MSELSESKRIWGRVAPERFDQLQAWAEELGMNFSQYIGVVSWIGAKALNRQLNPEQVLDSKQWAGIVAAYAEMQGLDLKTLEEEKPEIMELVKE